MTVMLVTRLLPVSFAAAATLVSAGTAHAAPQPLEGTYTARSSNQTASWAIRSTCVEDRCTANISSSSGWTATATLADGRWQMTVDNPAGIVCTHAGKPDTPLPATMVYSIDADTLTGTVGYQDHGECDTQPGWREARFSLTKVG